MAKVSNSDYKLIFRTLKYRNYRLFFGGQGISLIGTWLQMIAMGWLVYSMTNSAFMFGLIGFVSRIPTFVLAPFAGVLVDRVNKYKMLILTQVLSMLQALILAALVFTHTEQVWHLLALGLFLGIVNAFDMPVRQSFIFEIVEKKEDLSNAIALNSLIVNIGRFIGPSLAGILVALVGEAWCFSINAISFIAIISSLLLMRIDYKKIEVSKASRFQDFKLGFKYSFGFAPIRDILLLIALVSVMGIPYQVLMPIFAKDIYHGGADALGFMMASSGIGAIFGGFYLASRNTVRGLGKSIGIATSIFGLGLIAFSFSGSLYLSYAIMPFIGLGMIIQLTASNTILQTIVDDNMRGRVMSFYSMAFMGTVPFGNLLAGSLSSMIGAPNTILVGGVASLLGAIYFMFRLPELRKLVRPIYVTKGIIIEDI